jgi:PST family polysaccharide transporter
VWTASRNLLQIGLSLVALAVVARELGPETYGLFGVAMIVFGVAEMAVGGAVSDFLVPRKESDDGYTDATFWASFIASCIAAAAMAAFSPQLARWAGDARAAEVLQALAWLLPVAVGSRVPMTLLARDLHFKTTAKIGALSTTLGCATGIALALHGAGLWALFAMEAARASVVLLGSWIAVSWRPRLRLRVDHCRELARVWAHTLVTYSFGYADLMLPRLLVAHLLGSQGLGLFNLALRVPQEISRLLIDPLYDVAMSACARARNTGQDLPRLIVSLYASARLVAWPVFLCMAAVAPWLVPVLLGPKWQAVVLPMQILLVAGIRTSTGSFTPAILYGTGHIRSCLTLFAAGCILHLLLFPWLALWGIVGAALAMTARMVLDWPLASALVKHATGLSIRRQLSGGSGLLACASAAAMATWLTGQALIEPFGNVAVIALAPAISGLVYLTALRVFAPLTLRRAVDLLRAFMRRDKPRLEALLAQA